MAEEDEASSTRGESAIPVVTTVPGDALEQPRRMISGPVRLRNMFSALAHRNYRLYFVGQAISLSGTWMHLMAESWLVYQMTHSELALGAIRFLHTIPVTLLAVYAGVIADRADKRRILIGSQAVCAVLALILFLLVQVGIVQVWHVGVLALGVGIAHAFDIPARQSFVVEMVGKKDLMNAIALNSSIFNSARIIGPALGGVVLGLLGVSACFLINSISFAAVILAYLLMRMPAEARTESTPRKSKPLGEALRLLIRNPLLRSVLLLVSVVSLFVLPYTVLMPVLADEVLGVGAAGYGLLLSCNGVGALLGAMSLAFLGDVPRKLRLVFLGVFGLAVMMLVFALSQVLWLSLFSLMGAGWFMIIFFSTANTVVQLNVPDEFRGRIMGVYTFCFIGLSPFGSLMAGFLAKMTHVTTTLMVGSTICLVVGGVVFQLMRSGAVPRKTKQE